MKLTEDKALTSTKTLKFCEFGRGATIYNERYGFGIKVLNSESGKCIFVNLQDYSTYALSPDEAFYPINTELKHEPFGR